MFETSYSTQSSLLSSLAQNNTPQKRISEIFETSITNSGGPMVSHIKIYYKQFENVFVISGKTKKGSNESDKLYKASERQKPYLRNHLIKLIFV